MSEHADPLQFDHQADNEADDAITYLLKDKGPSVRKNVFYKNCLTVALEDARIKTRDVRNQGVCVKGLVSIGSTVQEMRAGANVT